MTTDREDPNSPARIEALRRQERRFKRAIMAGRIEGDTIGRPFLEELADREPLRPAKEPKS